MDANLFTEGSLYYYENRTNSKKDYKNPDLNHDFVVSRPVYIIESKNVDFDIYTVNALVITSSPNRLGIPININGYRNGKILPYAIYSLHKENLTRYLGHVSEEMRIEIKNAIKYHLGYTDEVPKYVLEYEKYKVTKEKMLKDLTARENTVYDLLENNCLFKDNYYVKISELFHSYRKRYADEGYTRLCDFTKCVSKLRKIYPEISIDTMDGIKIFSGLSLNGNIHRKERLTEEKRIKGIKSDNVDKDHELEVSEMNREQLIDALDPRQKKLYSRMDLVQKFLNRKRNPDKFDFMTIDYYNARIMKRLIEMDVADAEESIRTQLKNGKSPHDLNHFNQFILYHWHNKEIESVVNPKYRRKGVDKLKKSMKQKIQYLFNKRFS